MSRPDSDSDKLALIVLRVHRTLARDSGNATLLEATLRAIETPLVEVLDSLTKAEQRSRRSGLG